MNYYDEIKKELLNNEITKKVKNYSINKSDLTTYYNIGKLLKEAGKHYGEGIIKEYSIRLTSEFGKGYTFTSLTRMKKFYNLIEKLATVSQHLSYGHYVELLPYSDIDKINYYIKVNFTSLEDLVDALDGITVFSQYNFTSQDGYTYKYGENVLDGKKALSFARERKSFKDGDRERGKNQQLILTSIINKAISPKILTNYVDILKALKGKFVTNISDNDISKLIKMQLNNESSWNIKTISVDGSDAMDYVYSYKKTKLYVMKPDEKTVNNAKENIKNVLKIND